MQGLFQSLARDQVIDNYVYQLKIRKQLVQHAPLFHICK